MLTKFMFALLGLYFRLYIIIGAGKLTTFYVRKSLFQQHFTGQLQTRNIANVYVSIIIIFDMFIELIISRSNSQRSMLDFHKKNIDLRKKKFQRILPTFMLAYLINIYSFGAWGICG